MQRGRRKTSEVGLVAAALLVVAVACQPEADRVVAPRTEKAQADGNVHWGYEGDGGPERWADLSPEYALCRDGRGQSPVDLSNAVAASGGQLERLVGTTVLNLDQRARVMDLVDNGHTIQVTNDAPMSLDLDGEHFELVQYHFHAPSEHTIDGQHAPLEVHFVHRSAADLLAVIGVLVQEGAHDPVWDPILAALPSGPGGERHLEGLELSIEELQPLSETYYRYEGSLTTPPCSEGVQWLVMAELRQISAEQMAALAPLLRRNNRPVQPLGDRRITLVSR